MMGQVIPAIHELHRLLKVTKEFGETDEQLLSWRCGSSRGGFALEEEYEPAGPTRRPVRIFKTTFE